MLRMTEVEIEKECDCREGGGQLITDHVNAGYKFEGTRKTLQEFKQEFLR